MLGVSFNALNNEWAWPYEYIMTVQIQRRPIDTSLPLVDRILQGRGLTRNALAYSLNGLADFSSLKDIDIAAQILADAISQNKRILIIGDFDVDGATSTALAVDCLQKMGAAWVHYLVPNRFEYGYGLSTPIVDLAQKEYQPDLLVTVDNLSLIHISEPTRPY